MAKARIIFTKQKKLPLNKISSELNSLLKNTVKLKNFSLKEGGIISFCDEKSLIFVCFLNKDLSVEELQNEAGEVLNQTKNLVGKKTKTNVSLNYDNNLSKEDIYFLEKGLLLARSNDISFKSKKELKVINFTGLKNKKLEIIVSAIAKARILTGTPVNLLNPDDIEDYAKQVLKENSALKMTVLRKEDLEKEKMEMFLAVSKASPSEPRLILIEYNPQKSQEKPICLLGKGLMYDSGGYYPKPNPYMNEMYGDMGGAATVLGIMSALQGLGIKKRVIGALAVSQNMIDSNSYCNGDILTSKKGLTVEVEHTDAEGRLVLADSLTYLSEKFNPKYLFDFATLTGSCWQALGEMYTGVFSDNQKLLKQIQKTGEKTGDMVWFLPFDNYVKKAVKAKKADLTNLSSLGSLMGASTAAAFLSNFVFDTKKWVHFDVAGPALRDKMRRSYDLKNLIGTGPMVHTILEYLAD